MLRALKNFTSELCIYKAHTNDQLDEQINQNKLIKNEVINLYDFIEEMNIQNQKRMIKMQKQVSDSFKTMFENMK